MIKPCPACGRKGILLKRTGNCIHCSAGKAPPSSVVRNKPSMTKAAKPKAAKTRRPRGVKITNVTIVARNAGHSSPSRGGWRVIGSARLGANNGREYRRWDLSHPQWSHAYVAGWVGRYTEATAGGNKRLVGKPWADFDTSSPAAAKTDKAIEQLVIAYERREGRLPKSSRSAARNYAPAKKRWSKKAIKHPGKLGGPGFLRKPLAAQKRIMDKCVQDWGYKSCLGSLAFMANMPSGRPFRSRIALLREHLVATHGGSQRNPTGTLRGKGKRQWEHVYESQLERGLPKSRAAASAWSAVKKGYRKKGGKWQARNESQDRLREREIREHLGYAEHELKELREDGSKADAHVAQRAIDHARKLAERIDAERDRRQLVRMVAQYQERLDRVTGKSRNRTVSKRRSAGVRNKAFWGD
jgi:hypothetical protein